MSQSTREHHEKRAFPRSKGGCELIYKDHSFKAIDWSAGGCAIPKTIDLKENQVVAITLNISGGRTTLSQECEARVVRTDGDSCAFEFIDLSIEERDLLLIAQGAFSENLFVLDSQDDALF